VRRPTCGSHASWGDGRFKIVAPDLAGIVRHLAGGGRRRAADPGGNTDLALVDLPLLALRVARLHKHFITIYIGLRLSVPGRPTVGNFEPVGHPRSDEMD